MAQSTTSEQETITLSIKDHIATISLNRAEKFNALAHDVLEKLLSALETVAATPDIRVVILKGEGRAFCAGHDLKEMRADSSYATMKELFDLCSSVMLKLNALPQPVIARVHAIATAAGCQLVGACDLAIASTEARFATSGINVGLFCSTPMVALTRNVGAKKAFEMLVTGDFISAEQALAHGLVNDVVAPSELDNRVMELAQKIASQPPRSIAMGKELFYQQDGLSRTQAYEMAAHTMASNMLCLDARAGIDAFITKQPMPDWKGK